MVRRLPAGPSRRHPRTDACCGVVERDARLGILREVSAVARRNDIDDAQNSRRAAGVTHRHDSLTARLSGVSIAPERRTDFFSRCRAHNLAHISEGGELIAIAFAYRRAALMRAAVS